MSTWTLKEKSTGELEVVIEGEEWAKAVEKAFNKLAKNVTIHGFRKGCAPKALVEKQISMGERQAAAIDEHINEWLRRGLEETGVEPISQPSVDIREINTEKAVLVYTFQVMPEVTVTDYRGLHYAMAETSVSDEEVNAEIDRMRKQYADIEEKEGAAEDGDIVNINYEGFKEDVAFEGGKADNYDLTLGSGSFIPGFEEQLVGVKKGEEKDVEVTFPENYQAAELAGQPATFHCTVHEVKYKDLPELNDELIKKLKIENVETVDAYKEKVKTDLTAQKEREAEENFTNELLGKVCDNANVEIPAVMIDAEVDRMYKEFEGRMQQSGFTAKQFLEATHQTEEAIRAQMSPEAAARVKTQLVLEAIVKAESIEASDEDVEKEFTTMSEMYNMEVEKIKSLISPESIKADLANQKALDFIKTSVK